jgi:hypothetical protein
MNDGSDSYEYDAEEQEDMAKMLGISIEDEYDTYGWFINQCCKAVLPADWIKEKDPQNHVYFYNKRSGEISKAHPLMFRFRQLFNTLIE